MTHLGICTGSSKRASGEIVPEWTRLYLRPSATLFLANGATEAIRAIDVVRTPAGEVHGVTNSGSEPFVYLAVTVPPQDFTPAYRGAAEVSASRGRSGG